MNGRHRHTLGQRGEGHRKRNGTRWDRRRASTGRAGGGDRGRTAAATAASAMTRRGTQHGRHSSGRCRSVRFRSSLPRLQGTVSDSLRGALFCAPAELRLHVRARPGVPSGCGSIDRSEHRHRRQHTHAQQADSQHHTPSGPPGDRNWGRDSGSGDTAAAAWRWREQAGCHQRLFIVRRGHPVPTSDAPVTHERQTLAGGRMKGKKNGNRGPVGDGGERSGVSAAFVPAVCACTHIRREAHD